MHMRQKRARALVLIALLAAGTGVVAYATHLLGRSELQTIDARYSIRGKQKVPSDIVLVPIDNATVQAFRNAGRGQFPFKRRYDAQVIDRLRRAGAKTIAVDLEFTQQTDVADDNALIEAIGRAHGKVVLAASEVEPGGRTDVFGGPSLLRELGARAAEVRLRKDKEVDSDGVVRRLGYSYNGLRSFPVVSAEVFTGKPIASSQFEDGSLPIDYAGPPETIHSIPYAKVLAGQFPPSAFAGKIVIIGVSAPILGDIHATPTTGGGQMAGPEIQANATSTLLLGVPLRDAPTGSTCC